MPWGVTDNLRQARTAMRRAGTALGTAAALLQGQRAELTSIGYQSDLARAAVTDQDRRAVEVETRISTLLVDTALRQATDAVGVAQQSVDDAHDLTGRSRAALTGVDPERLAGVADQAEEVRRELDRLDAAGRTLGTSLAVIGPQFDEVRRQVDNARGAAGGQNRDYAVRSAKQLAEQGRPELERLGADLSGLRSEIEAVAPASGAVRTGSAVQTGQVAAPAITGRAVTERMLEAGRRLAETRQALQESAEAVHQAERAMSPPFSALRSLSSRGASVRNASDESAVYDRVWELRNDAWRIGSGLRDADGPLRLAKDQLDRMARSADAGRDGLAGLPQGDRIRATFERLGAIARSAGYVVDASRAAGEEAGSSVEPLEDASREFADRERTAELANTAAKVGERGNQRVEFDLWKLRQGLSMLADQPRPGTNPVAAQWSALQAATAAGEVLVDERQAGLEAVEHLREARDAVRRLVTSLDEVEGITGRTAEEWNIRLLADELRTAPDGGPSATGIRLQTRKLGGNLNTAATELWQATGTKHSATTAIAKGREVIAPLRGGAVDALRRQFDSLEAAVAPVEATLERAGTEARAESDRLEVLRDPGTGGYADRATRIADELVAGKGAVTERLRDLREGLESVLPAESPDRRPGSSKLDVAQEPKDARQALQSAAVSISEADRQLHKSVRRLESIFTSTSRIGTSTSTEELAGNLGRFHSFARGFEESMTDVQAWATLAKVQLEQAARMAEGDTSNGPDRQASERIIAIASAVAERVDAVIAPAEAMRQQLLPLQSLSGDLEQKFATDRYAARTSEDVYRAGRTMIEDFATLASDFQTFATQPNPGLDPVPASLADTSDPELSQAQHAGTTPRRSSGATVGEVSAGQARRVHGRDAEAGRSGNART
jgi:hypothetical protein